MGEGKLDALRVGFDGRLKLEFHGSKVTSDAGLLAYSERAGAAGVEYSGRNGRRGGGFVRLHSQAGTPRRAHFHRAGLGGS